MTHLDHERIANLHIGYCQMPSLWMETFNGLLQLGDTVVKKLPQLQDIPNSNKRLGKLAEELFGFWLKQNNQYTVVFENLQIIDNKQTLGELDICVYNSSSKKHTHIELVTKFYLYNPAYDCNDIEAWIGPNRNDSLKNKIKKLTNKQLPLLFNPTTKEKLTEFNLNPLQILQQVCFKAWLFVPINFKQTLISFNNQCIAGHYMTYELFKEFHLDTNQYFCPTKQDWLRFPESQKEWLPFSAVAPQIQLFMEAQQAIMVWIKNKDVFKRVIIIPYNEF